MISKGYQYVINLGISNFYISIDPVYPGSFVKDLSQQVNSGESGFSILHRSSSLLSTMILDRVQLEHKVFVFYLHHPCLFYPQYNLSIQVLFCFHFPHFYFAFNFVVLQKSAPQPAVLQCYTLKGHKQRTLISGSNLKGRKYLFWIIINLSDTFKTQMKHKKHSFCMIISCREKNGAQSIIS